MSPRPQAPGGRKPSNPDPVDWRARSQGLEEAALRLIEVLDLSESFGPVKQIREALALGLPDEEGEERLHDGSCPQPCPECAAEHDEATANLKLRANNRAGIRSDSGHGAAPPPRGAARQGPDVDEATWRTALSMLRGRTITGYATSAHNGRLNGLVITLDDGQWFQVVARTGEEVWFSFELHQPPGPKAAGPERPVGRLWTDAGGRSGRGTADG